MREPDTTQFLGHVLSYATLGGMPIQVLIAKLWTGGHPDRSPQFERAIAWIVPGGDITSSPDAVGKGADEDEAIAGLATALADRGELVPGPRGYFINGDMALYGSEAAPRHGCRLAREAVFREVKAANDARRAAGQP